MRGILGARTLAAKIAFLSLGIVGVFVALGFLAFIPLLRSQVVRARKGGIGQVVESAVSILAQLDREAQAGRITRAQARERGRDLLSGLHFDGTNYVFAVDPGPVMMAHGARPDLIGVPTAQLDPKLLDLYRSFIRVARDHPEGGYTDYEFTKPGREGLFPKTTFSKAFPPWGWTVSAGTYLDDVERDILRLIWAMAAVLLVLAGGVALASLRFAGRIARPLRELTAGIHGSLENLDLTHQVVVLSQDETAQAAEAFNAYNSGLRDSFMTVNRAAERVASGGTELAATADQMARTVKELAQVGVDLNRAGDEVTRAMALLQGNAEAVDQRVGAAVEQSGQVVVETQKGAQAGQEAAQGMAQIQRVTEEISGAVQIIQEIANQTNLLSLNAAIEAAKAGEHGKGFAVVADEVRQLAERSRDSAQEITARIESARATVRGGAQQVASTLENLQAVRAGIESMAASIREIGALARQQAGTSGQVVDQMARTSRRLDSNAAATQELNATVEEVARTTEELAGAADQLKRTVGRFRIQ
jgi:methyl-accepting chemotaxis protein